MRDTKISRQRRDGSSIKEERPPTIERRCNSAAANNSIFIFGDSFFDPGNNDYLNVNVSFKANYWPYGETFFKNNPTGRFSNGRLIPDFIALHVKLPIWKPYLKPGFHEFANGANFASGGSGILNQTNPGTVSLKMQLGYYKEVVTSLKQSFGDTKAKEIISNAVYMFSTGNNDIGQFLLAHPDNATHAVKQTFLTQVIGNFTQVIKEIYELGGRKFGIQYSTPMGCLPLVKQEYFLTGTGCQQFALYIARLFNDAVSQLASELETQLTGFKYSIFDFYSQILSRINDPAAYGFKVGSSACCGSGTYTGSDCGLGTYFLCTDPDEYVYFDGCHQTGRVYSQLSELWWEGGTNITWPYNLKDLFQEESPAIVMPSQQIALSI
ncbi:hypothetical protein ACFE04_004025 [Oxalis oulophora]